jgi:two-component system, NarL family, response regulator DegU
MLKNMIKNMEKIRILIADGHSIVREGLSSMLNKEPDFQVVGEAGTGQEAIDTALTLKPNVILLDLRIPGLDSLRAMTSIKKQNQSIRFVILTTSNDDEHIFQSIEAGANAYLLKDTPRQEILTAIRTVNQGESLIQPAIATKVLAQFAKISRELQESSGFSSREVEVLELIAKGLSNKNIAEIMFLSESTIKTHIQKIFRKLEVNDRTEAVISAVRQGILKT